MVLLWSGVGYDIGCGNKAVKTNLRAEDIDVAGIMDEIYAKIEFGIGRLASITSVGRGFPLVLTMTLVGLNRIVLGMLEKA